MISLTLPREDRRTFLRSFWIILSLIFGAAVWLVGWWFEVPFALTLALIAATACGLLVFVKQEFVRRLYQAWNRRIIRPYSNFASRTVMRLCFLIIFVAVGKTVSRFRPRGHTVTSWERRISLPAEAYELPYVARGEACADRGWIRGYLSWAIRSGNAWSISLLPFLWFLRLLSEREERALEANIYTLF
jgi:hypothetical protein